MANWGIGVGAFADGIAKGIGLGRTIREVRDENAIRSAYKEGIAGAKEARQNDINSKIQPAREGGIQLGYMDGTGKVHGSREDAAKSVERDVGSLMDYFLRDAAPKVSETLMSQGRIEQAQQWDAWVQNKNTQQGMKHWATALRHGQMGDMEGLADNLVKAYNTPGYYSDNLTVSSHKAVKDKDGNTTGYTFTFKNERTGEEYQQSFDGTDDLVRAGIGLLSPQEAFKVTLQENQQAAQARAKTAAEIAAENRGFKRDVALEDIKSGNRQEEIVTREQAQARYDQDGTRQEYNQNVEILRGAGISEDRIKELTPRILGISDTRAAMSDTDLRVKAIDILSSGAGGFRFNNLSPEEKERQIDATVQMIKGSQN